MYSFKTILPLTLASSLCLIHGDVFAASGNRKAEVENLVISNDNHSLIPAPIQALFQSQKSPARQTQQRPYEDLIRRLAAKHKIPVDLVHAVINTESQYNKNALGAAGEIGLMQIKPATARGLGFKGTRQALFQPEINLDYGMKYLAQAHAMSGGDTCQTILKYNAGHGAKRMNPISARYCTKVKVYMASLK